MYENTANKFNSYELWSALCQKITVKLMKMNTIIEQISENFTDLL